MIESWIKEPFKIREWIHKRARAGPLHHGHVANQRKTALYMTVFSSIRTALWIICMLLIIVIWFGGKDSFLNWFGGLSSKVIFVTFISFYCNAATDFAGTMASMSALFAADSHGSSETNRELMTRDYTEVLSGIARLAELQPGPDASALAAEIRSHLTGISPVNDMDVI
jgi:hypothetical protein